MKKREVASEALPTIWRVPDELWTIAEPILRPAEHPKGGRPWMDTRRALDGVLYVLRTGCQWRALPAEFGSATTVHDRFQRWVENGALQRLWEACLQRYGQEQSIQWAWQAADGCLVKAPLPPKKRTPAASVGPNPTDRGKDGSKRHVLTEGRGVPLATVVTAANVNDHTALRELLAARIAIAPPRLERPGLCVDAAYDNAPTEELIAAANYTPHIRRRGEARPAHDPRVEPRRWPVERTHAWHNRFRRLLIRWEKKAENWLALIHLANALIAFRACYW